jgi:hypothetical protein
VHVKLFEKQEIECWDFDRFYRLTGELINVVFVLLALKIELSRNSQLFSCVETPRSNSYMLFPRCFLYKSDVISANSNLGEAEFTILKYSSVHYHPVLPLDLFYFFSLRLLDEITPFIDSILFVNNPDHGVIGLNIFWIINYAAFLWLF